MRDHQFSCLLIYSMSNRYRGINKLTIHLTFDCATHYHKYVSFREYRSTAKLYTDIIIEHADQISFLTKFVYLCLETFPWKHWLTIDFIIICFELISRFIEIIDNATF